MPRNLMQTVGQSTVDNLTGDNAASQLPRIQVLLPADGTYHRGQLLVLDTGIDTAMLEDENLVGIHASIPDATATRVDAILLDDVGKTDEVVRAAAAIRGQWNLNAVLWGGIPEANQPAIIRDAWDRGLYIAPMNKSSFVQWGEE